MSTTTVTVTALRAEHRDGFGIGTAVPRLSWRVEADDAGFRQQRYEIEAGDPDDPSTTQTKVVQSPDSVLVAWPFAPLTSRARRRVRVRVTGAGGHESAWSDPLDIEVGLLDPADWSAVPITATLDGVAPERPIRYRRELTVDAGLVRARLYVSALGVYVAVCNGQAVGDDVLAPGWTSYRHRLRYRTFDVADLLRPGPNTLGITVAEGWYRGRLGFHGGRRDTYGAHVGPLAQLELHFADGTTSLLYTDGEWRAAPDARLAASLYDGEIYDAGRVEPTWTSPGFDDSGWSAVRCLPSVSEALTAPTGPPVRRTDTLRPVAITSAGGTHVVDFGQNISGRVRFAVSGGAGDEVTVRHAEVLDEGEPAMWLLRTAAATDTYLLAGGGHESFEPEFTIHGFRYASVDGWPGPLDSEAIEAVVCHSDLEPTGTFECSDDGLNRLHENIRWSMRGNFVDVPTDCPQRDERLGWTGDIQVFAPAACFLYDCAGFLESWLADVGAEQQRFGTVPPYVPWVELQWPPLPAAAWGDAAVIVPWVLYERFGDVEMLRRQYSSMCAWVDQIASIANDRHVWDEGFQFGDWLDPAAPPRDPGAARTDSALVATAYHARTARLVADAAALLGHGDDHRRYAALADDVTAGFNAEFVAPSGRISSDAQTAYALALCFDLLPTEQQRARAAARLLELVRRAGHCISTGFVGTPLVCDALVAGRYVDDAYHLLLQQRCPSWLYPVTMGATTVWERWDSLLPDGSINRTEMTSFNHYALGAVADFLHRRVAGLAPAAPGYRRLSVRPVPGGGLTHAEATLRTPYGAAAVRWRRVVDTMELELTVPIGSDARVELPDGRASDVGPGTHRFTCAHRPAEHDPPLPPPPALLLPDLDDDHP